MQIRGEDSGETFKIVCLCNKSNEPSGLPNVVMLVRVWDTGYAHSLSKLQRNKDLQVDPSARVASSGVAQVNVASSMSGKPVPLQRISKAQYMSNCDQFLSLQGVSITV